MASTRNINTKGNYCIQQKSYADSMQYNSYVNSQWGSAAHTAIPCLGITPSHMPWNALSNNPVEIESSLFGINSTNLVDTQPQVQPQLKSIPMISFFEMTPVIMPEKFVVQQGQRPFPIPE
jgi:hypothetical protein